MRTSDKFGHGDRVIVTSVALSKLRGFGIIADDEGEVLRLLDDGYVDVYFAFSGNAFPIHESELARESLTRQLTRRFLDGWARVLAYAS